MKRKEEVIERIKWEREEEEDREERELVGRDVGRRNERKKDREHKRNI